MAIVLHSYIRPENLTVTFVLDVLALLTGREKLKRWGTGIRIDFGTSLTNQFISLETAFNSVNNTDFEAGHSELNIVVTERGCLECGDPSTSAGLLSCEDFDLDD